MKYFLIFFFSLMVMLLQVPTLSAQWEPDVRLTYDDSTSHTELNNGWSITADGDTVHVVWFDNRDGNDEIYYKNSIDGGINWGTDVRLTDDPDSSYFPSIAVLGTSVHVVWIDDRDGNRELYYKRSLDGGTSWGVDTNLSNDPAWSWRPSVAVSGSYVNVVWEDWRGSYMEIYHKRSTDGGSNWETDVRLSDVLYHSCRPSVAISGNYVHVVWIDSRDLHFEIYYKRSPDNGVSWETDVRLSDLPESSNYCSVASSGNHVHVVWCDERNGNWEIYYKHSSDNGVNWDPDFRLTDDLGSSYVPSITALQSNIHVAWRDDRDGNLETYYKRSTDYGATWDSDLRLSDNDGFYSWRPSIAASGSCVHVVWIDHRDGNREIYYKRNPTGSQGIEEAEERGEMKFDILGNPVNQSVELSVPSINPACMPVNICIYDLAGRSVFRQELTAEPETVLTIPCTHLPPAVYCIRVSDSQNSWSSLFTVIR